MITPRTNEGRINNTDGYPSPTGKKGGTTVFLFCALSRDAQCILRRAAAIAAAVLALALLLSGCAAPAPPGVGVFVRPELFGGERVVPEPADLAVSASSDDEPARDGVPRAGLADDGRFRCETFSFFVCEGWRDCFRWQLDLRDDAGFTTEVYRFYYGSGGLLVFAVEKRSPGFSNLYGEYGGALLGRSPAGDSFLLVTEQPEFPDGFTADAGYMEALAFSLSDALDFRFEEEG